MEDIIFSQRQILDNIVLEGVYKYSAYITIGLVKGGDFKVIIEFNNIDLETTKELHSLYKLRKALKIESDLIIKENYNISHIVIEKFESTNAFSMTWECLSDDPSFSLEI